MKICAQLLLTIENSFGLYSLHEVSKKNSKTRICFFNIVLYSNVYLKSDYPSMSY